MLCQVHPEHLAEITKLEKNNQCKGEKNEQDKKLESLGGRSSTDTVTPSRAEARLFFFFQTDIK